MVGILRIKDQNGEWQDIQALRGEQGPAGPAGKDGPVGPQGPKGADGTMTFSDLTPEQKESLRGPQGIQGPQGEKGEKGDTGEKGADGAVGPQGEQGPIGETGPQGPAGENYVLTEEDKAEIAGMVEVTGGGSVAIDGTTIIENADGTISTAVGGSKQLGPEPTPIWHYNNATGKTTWTASNGRVSIFQDYQVNYAPFANMDSSFKYVMYVESRRASTGETHSASGMIQYSNANIWNCVEPIQCGAFKITDCGMYSNSSQGFFLSTSGATYQDDYITVMKIMPQRGYVYEQIDSGFIKIGGGLKLNGDGEIVSELAGLKVTNGTVHNDGNSLSNTNGGNFADSVLLGKNNGPNYSMQSQRHNAILLGNHNTAGNNYTVGVGFDNYVTDIYSVAVGRGLDVASRNQMVTGKYNLGDYISEYTYIIGNGNDNGTRKNALTINADNQVHVPGNLVVGEDKQLVATQRYVNEAVANAGGGNGSNVAVDGTTIINDGGVLRTAIGGYEHQGKMLVHFEGNYLSNREYDIQQEDFDALIDRDGDSVFISYQLDDDWYEDEYEVSYDKGAEEIVLESRKAEMSVVTINMADAIMVLEHDGEEVTILDIHTPSVVEPIRVDFIPVANGRGIEKRGSGLALDEEYIQEIVEDMGLGTTDSYNIRHEDSNVGEAINSLRDAVEGVTYLHFLEGEECTWEEELNTVQANINILDEELYNNIMNDMPEEILLSVDIQGKGWGRGFGCNAWREEFEGHILYVSQFNEDFDVESLIIDTTDKRIELVFRIGDFTNDEIREFTIRLMDIAKSVKFINPEEGIWVSRNNGGEEYRLGVKVDGSIGINRNGELMTESWWIPHGGTNVGNKLDELQHQLEGVEFLNFWMGTNFASNEEEMRLSADLVIDSGDIHNQVVFEDEAEEIELSCDFGLEHDWSNGFSGRFIRNIVTDEGVESIVYEANFDGGFITHAVINVTAGKIKFFFNEGEEDILNRPMNYMYLRLVNVNRFVKHIHVGDGLWVNRNDGGAVQTIGINVDSSLRFNDNRLGVNTNGLFTIIDEFMPIAWNVGPIDLTSDFVSFRVANRYSESDFVNWIENVMTDNPKLTLELRLEDGGSGGRGMPEIGWDEDGAGNRTYTIDMSSAIGPNFQNDTGIHECRIRYTTNSDNRFTVELSRDASVGDVPPLTKIVWGISNNQLGMAHYFIRNPEQFSFYNEDGYRYIEINESYINRLIDERIANYHANA